MNNYDKYFGDIDKTVKSLMNNEICTFCTDKDHDCNGDCGKNIRAFLEQDYKRLRNCDKYGTPKDLKDAFDKYCDSKICTKSQLYKQAGNSIVVNVLEAIFKEML